MSDSVAAAAVIDLYTPEPKRRASPPPPATGRVAARRDSQRKRGHAIAAASAAAAAAPNDHIIELLSDDDNDGSPTAPFPSIRTPRSSARKRHCKGMGRLKDYGEDGRKRNSPVAVAAGRRRTVDGAENSVIDLLSDTPHSAAAATSIKVSPEYQVLEVFPDADIDGIKNLLQQYNGKVEIVVGVMFEKGYKKTSSKPAALLQRQQNGISVSAPEAMKWSYDFMASDSFSPTSPYVKQAKSQLLYDFFFLSTAGADAILQHSANHYAKAHDTVISALKGTGDDETKFHRLDRVLQGSLPSPDQTKRLDDFHKDKTGAVLKRRSSRKRMVPRISDPILQEEMAYAQGKLQEFLETGRKHASMEKKKKRAKESNTAVECSCCYDGYDIDDMVACSREGHLFCVDCLKQYVESQIFGVGNLGVDRATKKPAHELKCFHGECLSGFDRRTLEKALPERTLKKYDEIQFNISLQAAGLANLVTCPKCGFQAELPYDQKFLVCPVETCKYESCRECGEPAHVGIRYVECNISLHSELHYLLLTIL